MLALQVKAREPLPVQNHDLALGIADEIEDTISVQLRHCTRNGFDGQTKVIGDVAPRHWERDHVSSRESFIHLVQERGNALQSSFTSEQQHMVFGVLQVIRRQAEQGAPDNRVILGDRLKVLPPDQANSGLDDRFRRKSVDSAVLESKNITRQMKCANLAPPIGE
jgi:hypothetical protein